MQYMATITLLVPDSLDKALERQCRAAGVSKSDIAREALERESAGERVTLNIPADLSVLADRDLLGRALGNLVRNALRYAANTGPIRLSALPQGPHVTLTVSDHGPGVPESELDRIFEPFYRPDTARTRETGGTGLGLAIVRTCVAACQGTVTARPHHPSGLEVHIRLALAPSPPGSAAPVIS